ncbi:MAG: DUF5329 family protein [Phycisphaerae bacterium]|nr:DUF5329 family protein [Phycisphaerae bacterium]
MQRMLAFLLILFLAACRDRDEATGPMSRPAAAADPNPIATTTASEPSSSVTSTAPNSLAAKKLSERRKIERLIEHVESLEGAVFIRNGDEHTCREAAGHLRDKWQWKRREIRTSRDFIRVAATKSSVSGQPYLIRFNDGREVRSDEYLLKELKRIESGSN